MLGSRCRVLLFAVSALALVGCQTPRVYEITYHDPSRVIVQLEEPGVSKAVRLEDPAPEASARLEARAFVLAGPLRAHPYVTVASRAPDGALLLRFEPSQGQPEAYTLVGADGALALSFPTSTGDGVDFPGFHLEGVTSGARLEPMTLEEGVHGLHFSYRPSYDTQRALKRQADVQLSLLSPLDNVRSVTRHEKPPRLAYGMLLGVASLIALGGGFIAWPRDGQSDGERNFRLGVGLPLLAVGVGAGIWSGWMLTKTERRVEIPPSEAFGMP